MGLWNSWWNSSHVFLWWFLICSWRIYTWDGSCHQDWLRGNGHDELVSKMRSMYATVTTCQVTKWGASGIHYSAFSPPQNPEVAPLSSGPDALPRVTIPKYHRPHGLHNRTLFPHGSGEWKPKMRVLAVLASPEASLLSWLEGPSSLHPCPQVPPPLLHKNVSPGRLGPTLTASF